MATQTDSDLVTFGVSTKGRRTVIYRNFEYVKVRDNKNGEIYWRCKMYQSYKCKGHLNTLDDRIVSNKDQEHSHQGNIATSLARLAVGQMKERMGEASATPAAVVGTVSRQLDNRVLQALPKRSTLARSLQRHRKAALADNDDGTVLPPPPRDTNFDVPQRFADMILYDSGRDENRVLIFGCDDLLDGLARSKLWLADGTFKVVPSIFFQLYTIHFELVPGNNPVAVYCLRAHVHPWTKTGWTKRKLRTKFIPDPTLESISSCSRRNCPNNQRSRGMALWSPVFVPVSSSYSLDLLGWNLKRYSEAEI